MAARWWDGRATGRGKIVWWRHVWGRAWGCARSTEGAPLSHLLPLYWVRKYSTPVRATHESATTNTVPPYHALSRSRAESEIAERGCQSDNRQVDERTQRDRGKEMPKIARMREFISGEHGRSNDGNIDMRSLYRLIDGRYSC